MDKLLIIMVAFHRVVPLRIAIDSFLVQTDPNWELHIIHDGKAPAEVRQVIADRKDQRIHYTETPTVNGKWGHPNRRDMLQKIEAGPNDFILLTNDDNYYVPTFVAMVRGTYTPNAGIIYYNTLHNYFGYVIHESRLKECFIDMGAFVVRSDVAKAVGFRHDKSSADGIYAEECDAYCLNNGLKANYIARAVPFVHN
jgi:hypothetical protein